MGIFVELADKGLYGCRAVVGKTKAKRACLARTLARTCSWMLVRPVHLRRKPKGLIILASNEVTSRGATNLFECTAINTT